jgi:ferric-dicitrate binding protein FerR (iron transport regulator)
MAAVLVVGVGLGTFFLLYNFHNAADRSISDADTSFVTRTLEAKKASTLYLADGSVVWLKKGSTLEYPETFQGDTREVQLTGEAFFDVAKNPDKPFIIHSGNFTTRVVGTSFNIRAYRSDDSAEVVVVTGRVVVSVNGPTSKKGSEVILHPNQRAVYSKKTHTLVESGATPEAVAVAADMRKLAFDETQLSDILRVLNATYDVHITVSSENMNNCVITADLTNEDLEFAMIILAKAINATYSISGKDILLRGNGCGLQ